MQRILLTWYGLSDLRASLTSESLDGPVLSAIKAGKYTDIVLLGYTNISKSGLDGQINAAEIIQSSVLDGNGESTFDSRYISKFANTHAAHEYYVEWLKEKLNTLSKPLSVTFQNVELRHLNDTANIYKASLNALSKLEQHGSEIRVSVNISSGTPLMAIAWALATLKFPQLKKRLIASSQPNKPPEVITPPNEWLERYGQLKSQSRDTPTGFDAIFHLFGEQRMPALLGTLQFECEKHYFISSRSYPADVMRQFTSETGFRQIYSEPYDPESVSKAIQQQLQYIPEGCSIGFNLTGGTKLMFAGALSLCRQINATPFYFNSRNNEVIFLDSYKKTEIKPVSTVETYIRLNGNNLFISKAGCWADIPGIESADRIKLTNELWKARSKIARLYKELSRYNDSLLPFELHNDDIYVKLSKDKSAKISIGTKHFDFKKWPEFAKYLSGGWFEEYTFMKLQPLVNAGLIKEMRIGLEISSREGHAKEGSSSVSTHPSIIASDPYQELDITFTDGKRLYIIECKAGDVNSGHVMKLQNIVRYFGGIEGRAFLASCFKPKSKVVRKKIDDSKNIQLVPGNNLLREIKKVVQSGGLHQ